MTIALIGYRGSGKSAVAQHVAARLGWTFVDADELLEAQAGRTIREIFAAEGESGFRDRESAILDELVQREQCVLALGGGVIIRESNRRLLQDLFVVWLRASPEVLYARISADAQTAARRPGLTSQGGLDEVRTLLTERTPWYASCADLTIDTDHLSPDQIADQIIARFRDAN